ncbi:hypothetical protein HALA3H3_410006 [Halomonas sp. A3H3]|nr:hypothetical protein HALA3H3_410006 [Halomonas sp. A3H3]
MSKRAGFDTATIAAVSINVPANIKDAFLNMFLSLSQRWGGKVGLKNKPIAMGVSYSLST